MTISLLCLKLVSGNGASSGPRLNFLHRSRPYPIAIECAVKAIRAVCLRLAYSRLVFSTFYSVDRRDINPVVAVSEDGNRCIDFAR